MARLTHRRTRQPQPGAWAALSDAQLASGLTSLWSATLPLIDVRRRVAATVSGTWAPSTSVTGVGYRAASGTPHIEFTPPAAATSTDYTVFAYVTDDTGSGAYRNPIDADDQSSARVFQLRFKNDDGVEFITFDTSGNPYFATGAALSFAPRVGLLVGRIVGNQLSVWWQGKQYATGSASGTPKAVSAAALLLIGCNKNAGGTLFQGFPGQIFLAGHYNRGLGDAEIVALSRNPWQLFAPVPRRSRDAAAGGATTISATPGQYTWAGASAGLQTFLNVAPGQYTWTGASASIAAQVVAASPGAYTWAGSTSAILAQSVSATPGAYTWTGVTAAIVAQSINAVPGVYTWAGVTASFSGLVSIDATPGAYTWGGAAAGLQANLNATPGQYTWAGISAAVAAQSVDATPGAWSWGGVTATFPVSIVAAPGLYTWAGVTASIGSTEPDVHASAHEDRDEKEFFDFLELVLTISAAGGAFDG